MNQERTISECVKNWLKEDEIFNDIEIETDYLNPNIIQNDKKSFSLEQKITQNPIIKRNVLGTKTMRQQDFVLAGRFSFDVNNENLNNENLKFMENIKNMIIERKLKRDLPILNDKEECTGLEIISSPCLFGIDKSTTYARYQLELKILYEKREI